MNKHIKAIALLCLLALLCAACTGALAKTEPNSKTIEETNTYDYGSLKITIDRWCYAFNKTSLRFFVANVYVDDPSQLKTAFAGEKYSKDAAEAPSDIAARHDAVLATNGDYYNYKDNSGLVIRGGELYRDLSTTRHQLLVYEDGTFEALLPGDYKQGTGAQYIEAGVVQSFTFGPLLVDNYEITELPQKYYISTKDTIREPRTAIGQVDANHYVVIVADGRRDGWSDLGMTLQELQEVFVEQGCRIAYNLDGGGSASMVLDGERVNRGSASRERNVSDIIYFTR
ncbi:MAG: phosphodiester glycosidase family protein [Candidatus Ventricola sp.]